MHSYKGFFLFCGIALLACLTLQSCDDEDSYGKRKSKERKTINSFIKKGTLIMAADAADTLVYVPPIKVISEKQFEEQDSTTDVSKNEYVYFPQTGIYMQIVRRGCGSVLKNGEKAAVLCRYKEYNINERNDSAVLVSFNDDPVKYQSLYDKIDVVNNSGTFKKSWSLTEDNTGYQSRLYAYYASKYKTSISVPEGWLVPLSYIKLGRPQKEGDEIAKVRLIVPHEMGHEVALKWVCAFYYEITYERGI